MDKGSKVCVIIGCVLLIIGVLAALANPLFGIDIGRLQSIIAMGGIAGGLSMTVTTIMLWKQKSK